MGNLDHDTQLAGSHGRYTITLSGDWEIWGPNGGYMAAIALRAAGMEAAIKRPVSISCHFLGVAKFEPVDVQVRVVQSGRRAESLHVEIAQQGRRIVQAIVRTAAEAPGIEHNFLHMPEVPPPSALKSFLEHLEHMPDPPGTFPFWENLDSRIIMTDRVNRDQTVAYDADLLEWYRFQPRETFDDPFIDAARSVILMDTMAWPAGANPHPYVRREYQAVNLDVVAWFYEPAPNSPWLLCDYDAPLATAGLVAGRGRVWSEDGRLVAMGGAQLLCLPMQR